MKRISFVVLGSIVGLGSVFLILRDRTTRTDWYIPKAYHGWACLAYDGEARWWYLPQNRTHYFSTNGLAYDTWHKNSVWTQNHFWAQGVNGKEELVQQPAAPDQNGVWGLEVLTFPGDPQLSGRIVEVFFVGTGKEFKAATAQVATDPNMLPDFRFLESQRDRIVHRMP